MSLIISMVDLHALKRPGRKEGRKEGRGSLVLVLSELRQGHMRLVACRRTCVHRVPSARSPFGLRACTSCAAASASPRAAAASSFSAASLAAASLRASISFCKSQR